MFVVQSLIEDLSHVLTKTLIPIEGYGVHNYVLNHKQMCHLLNDLSNKNYQYDL